MKTQYVAMASILFLLGCNPFEARQNETQEKIVNAENKAKNINKRYEPDIRKIKPYQTYQYQSDLNDPFRIRQFLKREEEKKVNLEADAQQKRCLPPQCMPPEQHEKQLLENYTTDSLAFVGTLNENQDLVALIRTPDYGVVTVKKGDYMGRKNGKVQEIRESVIILQEKVNKNGLWKNKKTVLRVIQ